MPEQCSFCSSSFAKSHARFAVATNFLRVREFNSHRRKRKNIFFMWIRHVGASRIKLAPIFLQPGAHLYRAFLQRVSFCGSFVTIFLLSGSHRDFFAGYESRIFHAVR